MLKYYQFFNQMGARGEATVGSVPSFKLKRYSKELSSNKIKTPLNANLDANITLKDDNTSLSVNVSALLI